MKDISTNLHKATIIVNLDSSEEICLKIKKEWQKVSCLTLNLSTSLFKNDKSLNVIKSLDIGRRQHIQLLNIRINLMATLSEVC